MINIFESNCIASTLKCIHYRFLTEDFHHFNELNKKKKKKIFIVHTPNYAESSKL